MKLHLPILLRRAVLAVMAALAASPAVVADEYVPTDVYTMPGDSDGNAIISRDYKSGETYYKRETIKQGFLGFGAEYKYYLDGDTLIMQGTVTNRIETGFSGNNSFTVDAKDNVTMRTEGGVNAITGNIFEIKDPLITIANSAKDAYFEEQGWTGGLIGGVGNFAWNILIGAITPDKQAAPTVKAGNSITMDGPANLVMFGSTVEGKSITLTNSGSSITSADAAVKAILGDASTLAELGPVEDMLNSMKDIKGNFNIVQGSTIGNANTEKITMHADVAGKTIPVGTSALGANIVLGGSTIKAQEVELTGMASVIANIPLKDVFNELAEDPSAITSDNMMELVNKSLDTGKATKIEATTGNIDLDTQYNVLLGCGTGEDQALTVSAANGDVNMTGALNVVAGNTKVTAENINMTPNKTVSINELTQQLGGLLPVDLGALTDKLGDFADQPISANIVAGGANLTATGEDGIKIGGTAGILVNTKVSDLVGALGTLQEGHEMLFAKEVLSSGAATKVEATNGNIELGAQLNLVHGGNLADKGEALTITANNGAVTLQGTGNVISGNVVVDANKGISMMGERLPADLAALGDLVGDFTDSIPGVGGVIDKLVQKGNANIVTGGATLKAGAEGITMSDIPVDAVGKTNVINAVLDTQFTDVITAVINGEPSAILPTTDPDAIKATTTLSSGGNIDMLGRVNVVAGLRGNVDVDAEGNVNLQGSISMIAGNATVDADSIKINTSDEGKYKMHLDADELGGLPLPGALEGVLGNMELVNAAVVAGGAELTAQKAITTGGTAGILLNTPMADVIKEFNPLSSTKNPSELEIVQSLLQKGTATTITSKEGNINLGSQLNVAHGGGFTEDGANALTLTANNGAVNMQGTGNVVSGNVVVDAKGISMMGERLPADMAALGGLVGDIAGELVGGLPAAANGMLDKLVQKGSVNVVTGGATLTAGANGITMSDIPVDDVGATGAINAVLDTDLAGLLGAMTGDNTQSGINDALIAGGSHQTTLKSEGDINMLGRVNVVNGGKVVLDAKGNVNLQGSASLISGGATVTANNININTDEAKKYKMYFDSTELGGLVPEGSPFAPIVNSISGLGLNAAVVTGGAELTATGNINTGGTLGLVMNMPISEVFNRLGSTNELWEAMELLNTGVATTVTSTNGNINLGSQLNLVHGGNFTDDGANVLTLTANNGAVNVQGSVNVVSGNTQVNANKITLTGERLPADMAGAAGGVVGSVAGMLPGAAGSMAGMLPGAAGSMAGGMLDKLVQKGAANIVTGGATLTAGAEGITMSGVHETGAINAVLDTEIPGLLRAFMEGNDQYVVEGGIHQTTLKSAGNIDMLGRVNVVNGGKVVLDAKGNVNLQGSASLISGGATVNAQNININTDESADYKIYFDSTELGGLVPEGSPFAPIVDSISGMGLNAAVVTGGAELTAQDNITIGGTLGLVVNTPLSAVMTRFESYLKHQQETYLLYELLQPGTATTVKAENGNIEVGAQFNLLHGGGFTANAGENALVVSAANGAVNVEGSFNVISGNTQVNAQEINMTGVILPADMAGVAGGVVDGVVDAFVGELPAAADNMLDRLIAKGNANIVTGGATLTATGEKGITMTGAANAVIDTELVDVIDAFMQRDTKPLEDGGNHMTTLKSGGNIDMLGRLNVVNGAYVTLDAAKDVNLKGTVNVVSGNATVKGNNINIVGQQNLGLDWETMLPGDVGNYMDQVGITDKLDKGVNGNLVLGGAVLDADNDITISGMASVVMNTPVGGAFDALNKKLNNDWYPELWLVKEVLAEGIATTLNAGNNIVLDSRLNVLHGGNFAANGANALALTAGNTVKLDGTLNMVSGNVTVNAQNIELNGGKNVGLDLSLVVDKALGAEYTELAKDSGIIGKIASKGLNANIVTGGATLNAKNDITMNGMANAVLDTDLVDVVDFVEKGGDPASLVEGGNHMTTLKSGGNIDMQGRLNVVNGAYVTLDAAKDVNLKGTVNVVSGKATVKGNNINIVGQQNVGLEWGELIPDKYAGYGDLADKMGILDKVNGGVNGSVIAGGAKVTAKNDININGMAGAVVDTTPGSVMEALQNMIGTPLLEGETENTTLTAGGDINMNTRFNVVNGGKTLLDAGKDVNLGGTFNVVATNANVNAKGNINMTAKNKVGVDISPLLNGHYAELAEEMGMTDVLKNGVSSNVVSGGAKLSAEGDVVMSGVATAIADTTINNVIGAVKGEDLGSLMQGGRNTTTVTAKNDIKLESQLNVVNGGNSKNAGGVELNAGRDVIVSGDINVVNRATVKAGNNVDFGGDLSVVKYSDIDAAKVSFTGKKAEITDVNFNTASVAVISSALVNTAGSEVAIKSLDVELGNIENLGTLELDAAALAGSTLHNEGSITVNGELTLNSATLSFVADSNNSTLGSTAITLGDNGYIAGITTFTGNSSADMIAGVSFMLNYDALKFIDNTNEFAFELAIFQGATEDEWSMLKAAIANDELTLTLNNGYNVESINSLEVVYSENGGIVSLKGTASVPEPTTATLSLLALAALAARRRRR